MVLSSEPAKIAGRSPDGRVGWPLRLSPAGESKCAETGVSGRAGGSKCAETERPPSAVANLQKRGPSLKSYFPPLPIKHVFKLVLRTHTAAISDTASARQQLTVVPH